MKKFYNRENELIKGTSGKEYWISRSVALVATLFAKVEDSLYVLIEKRSVKMDFPGLYCVVCGYLDWDESGWEGISREIYEETSLDVDKLKDFIKFDNNKVPYFVNDNPSKDPRQNVSHNYVILFDFTKNGNHAMLKAGMFKGSETDEIKWIKLDDLKNYEWAFEHDKRIRSGFNYLVLENVFP